MIDVKSKKTGYDMSLTKQLAICARLIGLTLCVALFSCAVGRHGTLVMYSSHDQPRLSVEEVAKVVMQELAGLRDNLWIRVDSSRDVPFHDTLEVLPGEHIVQLWDMGVRSKRSPSLQVYPPPGQSCQQFEFVAEVGHRYVFRLVEYSLSAWNVDLIDGTSGRVVLHGQNCPRTNSNQPVPQ